MKDRHLFFLIVSILAIIVATLLIHQPLGAQSQTNWTEDSVVLPTRQFIVADIAGFPFNHTHSGSWRPYQSLRVGYGRDLGSMLELRVCAEYSTFDFDNHDGLSIQDYSPGKRRDFAIYPAIGAFGMFEFALGGYYTIQDEVFHHSIYPPQLAIDPGVKKIGFYYHFGAGSSIHVAGPVNISLGLYLRNVMMGDMYFGCRAGIKYDI